MRNPRWRRPPKRVSRQWHGASEVFDHSDASWREPKARKTIGLPNFCFLRASQLPQKVMSQAVPGNEARPYFTGNLVPGAERDGNLRT